MSAKTESRREEIRERLKAIGQDHVLQFCDDLDEVAREHLLDQIEAIDLDALPALIDQYVRDSEAFGHQGAIEPAPYYPAPTHADADWDVAAYRAAGEELIRANRIAAFTVAGGQGTRLGFDGPKGTYPAGAVTGKPLFQCLAEWIRASRERYAASIPWYIMTSPLNHEATLAFFEENAYFGLPEADVMLFQQGVMPPLSLPDGKLLLADHGCLATNPDGHGGSLRALHTSGALRDMRDRGVAHVSYVQVDNPLARVIDPIFIGLHASAPDSSGEMSSKMVAKASPGEKVGVFSRVDGRTQVIEYSDMPEELACATDDTGRLRFNAGSIALHLIGVDFIESLMSGGRLTLPFHRAVKKVPHVDLSSGALVQPEEPNAVKLEMFVFDALPKAKSSIVYEVDRIEEFAPIKNASGTDSPESCHRIQTARAARWLEVKGMELPRGPEGDADCVLELSPLTAMWPEDLDRLSLPTRVDRGSRLAL